MTASKAVEKALAEQLEASVGALANVCAFVGSEAAHENIELPAVMIVGQPLDDVAPLRDQGYVDCIVNVRTAADLDGDRSALESIFETATGAITPANIGPRIDSPWLLCGIDNTTEGGAPASGVSSAEETRIQSKFRGYRFAMFKSA